MSGAKSMKRKVSVEEEMDIVVEFNKLDLEWSEDTVSLMKFAQSFTRPQPISICEGQYEEWGANTEENPDLYPLLFALYRRFKFKIEAQCVNFSPDGGKVPVGPKFEIFDDFDGWFEIISEDGAPMFQIESVSDLAAHPSQPFVLMKSMHHAHKFRNERWEKCTLDISYEIKVDSLKSNRIAVRGCGCGRLLQCTSYSGEEVYLPVSEPGRFSLIGDDYITGPQTISSLIAKRFPINVRLMDESPRPIDFEGFVPTLVLHKCDFELELTVWPMQKDVPLVHIPTNCPMQLKTLKNLESLLELPVYNEIVRRINSFVPKCKTRPRWYQHTQSSLRRSLLQKTSTTTASRRRYTARVQAATSATGIRPPSTSNQMTLSSTSTHQPSTSGHFKSTSTDNHQPSTFGHFKSTSTVIDQLSTSGNFKSTSTDIPSWFSTGTTTASGSFTNTSGYLKPNSTSIHQPSTSGYFKPISTDIHQPSTSGYFKTSSTDIPSWFSATTTTASGPFTPTTKLPSNPSLPRTSTTYGQHSTARQTTKATTDIHQPSTSGLQSSFSAFKKWTSKRFSKQSRSSMSKTSEESDYQPHESNLADPHLKDEVRSKEMKETRADYQASGYSTVHSDMFCTLNIDSKSSGDDTRTLCSDATQEGKLHPKPIGGIDNQKTSGQAVLEPSSDRPSSRIETLNQRDDEQTSDLFDARSLEARGDQPTSRDIHTSRIETKLRKGNQELSGYAFDELRQFRLELLGDFNPQQTSGQAAIPPMFYLEPLDDIDHPQISGQAAVQPRWFREEPLDDIGHQQTSGQAAVQPKRFRSEPLDGIAHQRTSGRAAVRPREVGARPHDPIVNPLSPESPEGDEPPSTDPDDGIDLLDEIDEIYAENRRIYNERRNIPLEEESSL